jgi:outer membrane lipoprotein-sorting protein
MLRRRHGCAALIAAAAGVGLSPAHAETPLEALMRRFAAIRASRATFTEEKAIPELELPLPSRGTLSWQAPDRLEKHTTAPIEEILRIEGDRLTLERPQQDVRQTLSLDRSPEIRPLVEAIRATLAGDLATLRRHYAIAFEGDPAGAWRMVLTPLSPRVLAAVQRITLTGRGAAILSVESQQGGGVSRMRIEPAR